MRDTSNAPSLALWALTGVASGTGSPDEHRPFRVERLRHQRAVPDEQQMAGRGIRDARIGRHDPLAQ